MSVTVAVHEDTALTLMGDGEHWRVVVVVPGAGGERARVKDPWLVR
jgi:hypothetical protein